MRIFLSGPHGIGKTTFVNNLCIDKPLVKVVDTDLIDMDGVGRTQQIQRIDQMIELLNITKYDCIYDRSPFDFLVYNKLYMQDSEYKKYRNILIEIYYKLKNSITIGILSPFDLMEKNIKKRNRGKWEENDRDRNLFVWNEFTRLYSEYDIPTVRYQDLDFVVKRLFFDHKI